MTGTARALRPMVGIVALLASRPTGPHLQEPGDNALSRTREAGMPGTGEKASSGSRSALDFALVVSTQPELSHAEARALHGVIAIATNAIGFDQDGFDHSEEPYHRCTLKGARPIPGQCHFSPSARQVTEPRALALGACVPSMSGVDAVAELRRRLDRLGQSLGCRCRWCVTFSRAPKTFQFPLHITTYT